MTYFTFFGQAVREAVESAMRGHNNCILLTQSVRDMLGESAYGEEGLSLFGVYRRKRMGKLETVTLYIARVGDYQHALDEQGTGACASETQSEFSLHEVHGAVTHLRAFLRMSGEDGVSHESRDSALTKAASADTKALPLHLPMISDTDCMTSKEWELPPHSCENCDRLQLRCNDLEFQVSCSRTLRSTPSPDPEGPKPKSILKC